MSHNCSPFSRIPARAGIAAALGLASLGVPALPYAAAPALACNPEDCRGLRAEELARDRAEIRRLNREQLRYVRTRDAEYARGWEARRAHAQALADHEQARAEYERRMEQWREAVRRCEAGEYRHCAG